MRRFQLGLVGVVVVLATGCFVSFPDGAACNDDDDCPPGQVCRGGMCTKSGGAGGGQAGGTAGAAGGGGTSPSDGGTGGGSGTGEAVSAMGCFDGIDNDMDGQTDCADVDCGGRACRASLGVCDPAELCTSGACPDDVKAPSTQTCRAAAGLCDAAERCEGLSAACPTDQLLQGTECRAASGDCDVAERCTGQAADCPADTFAPATQSCRAASGACDVEDFCSGDAGACLNRVQLSGMPCRGATGACDLAELCDGVSTTCPSDGFADAGVLCRPVDGGCDSPEVCTGGSRDCPPDGVSGRGTSCRAPRGPCDFEETCDGLGSQCPPDVLHDAGTVCIPSRGACDPAERCSGASAQCPSDGLHPAGFACRPGTGCDFSEVCDGGSPLCPDDVSSCNGNTFCNTANMCVARLALGAACTTNDQCDSRFCATNGVCCRESCNRGCEACAADGMTCGARPGVVCRAAVHSCDVAETCGTTRGECPPNAVQPSTFACRPVVSGNSCDVPEFCGGDGGPCPSDVFASSSTSCRTATLGCDVTEFCTGSAPGCPVDRFRDAGVVCNAAQNDCDVAEVCSGTQATCPPDVVRTQGSPCGMATCSAGMVFPGVCQSSMPPSMCGPGAAMSCDGFQCTSSGTACRVSCSGAGDCLSTHYCDAPRCVRKLGNGQPCTSGAQCLGGVCASFFRDGDSDGFGAGAPSTVCSNSSAAPAGFSSVGTDCCDVDRDARPNQTRFFDAVNACRNFDYNCNTFEDPEDSRVFRCTNLPPDCSPGWVTSIPRCGDEGSFRGCGLGCGGVTPSPRQALCH